MAKRYVKFLKGRCYHIYNRGAHKAPIFGDGVSLGAKAGKCSYCHTAKSLNPPNLVDPFDPARGVVNVNAIVGGTGAKRVITGVVIVGAVVLDAWRHRMTGSPFPFLKRLFLRNQ